jgi:hypothetical protein
MAGSIAGTLIRGDTRPKVPKFTPIDVTGEQREAIAGNISNLPEAARLGAETNKATTDQYLTMLERIIPGFSQLNSKAIGNIKSLLSGELPSDVENRIGRYAAERGIVRGTGGNSEFEQYAQLRDLGLTSLEMTDRGLDAASRWMATTTGRAPFMDFTSMFITPQQRIQTQQWNKSMQWNRDWLRNQIAALPNQYQEAAAGFFDNIEEIGQSVLSSYAGGAMGGGGGGGGGGRMGGQMAGKG